MAAIINTFIHQFRVYFLFSFPNRDISGFLFKTIIVGCLFVCGKKDERNISFCFSPRGKIVLKSQKPALKIDIIDGGENWLGQGGVCCLGNSWNEQIFSVGVDPLYVPECKKHKSFCFMGCLQNQKRHQNIGKDHWLKECIF